MDWRTAYLRQAASDYAVYEYLQSVDAQPLCHRLHFLQTENLPPGGSLGEHPNPEYPWLDISGNVRSPLDGEFDGLEARENPRRRERLQLIEAAFAVATEE